MKEKNCERVGEWESEREVTEREREGVKKIRGREKERKGEN